MMSNKIIKLLRYGTIEDIFLALEFMRKKIPDKVIMVGIWHDDFELWLYKDSYTDWEWRLNRDVPGGFIKGFDGSHNVLEIDLRMKYEEENSGFISK